MIVARHYRHLTNEQDTLAFGAALAGGLRPGMALYLSGELGAGKTTLARGILRALGWDGPVKSPTFTLIEPYLISSLYLYHFDFYRFEDGKDVGVTEFRDYFNTTAICMVEWPEKVAGILPEPDLLLTFALSRGRDIEVVAYTEAGGACITHLQN